MEKYDFLIVGSGLFGSTCARTLSDAGFKVLVLEKRNHVGGNIYTKKRHNIHIHIYGAHIFHTSNKKIWDFVNKYCEMLPFTNSPLANYHGEIYHMPFNMNTFHELWGVNTPEEAKAKIAEEVAKENIKDPQNLEEQALSMVGRTIYTKLVKEYTEKQWGRDCKELPAFIIKRLPLRFEYNNNYFNDVYQGIPKGGYTKLILNLLNGIDVETNKDFLSNKEFYNSIAKRIIYTGSIDEYYDYCFGHLEYRSLAFKISCLSIDSYQNNAVVNYTSHEVPFTRIIEHKFFENNQKGITIISKEYPKKWSVGKERFYPVNDDINNNLYSKYLELSKKDKKVLFGGRLGSYKYSDMDDTIEEALVLIEKVIEDNDYGF